MARAPPARARWALGGVEAHNAGAGGRRVMPRRQAAPAQPAGVDRSDFFFNHHLEILPCGDREREVRNPPTTERGACPPPPTFFRSADGGKVG